MSLVDGRDIYILGKLYFNYVVYSEWVFRPPSMLVLCKTFLSSEWTMYDTIGWNVQH